MDSPRQFACAACRQLVLICSHCDRGNRYCSAACSSQARRARSRAAGERYQSTRPGRLNNANRQRRWRERQLNKVTHQGSLAHPESAVVALEPIGIAVSGQERGCCVCARPVSDFVRLSFCHRTPYRPAQTSLWRKTTDDFP